MDLKGIRQQPLAQVVFLVMQNMNTAEEYKSVRMIYKKISGSRSVRRLLNVAESGQFVFVRVTVNNYESKVFCSDNRTSITERSFTDTKVTLEPETVIYKVNPGTRRSRWLRTGGDLPGLKWIRRII